MIKSELFECSVTLSDAIINRRFPQKDKLVDKVASVPRTDLLHFNLESDKLGARKMQKIVKV